jgi:hypothetical protein
LVEREGVGYGWRRLSKAEHILVGTGRYHDLLHVALVPIAHSEASELVVVAVCASTA